MKKFGLIGHPITHSQSPALFKAGYGGKYAYDLIEGEVFEASYQKFLDSYDGINVTAPFKEKAFAKADILSEECKLAGAANILVKTPDGKVKAHNSDYLGIRKWLEDEAIPRVRQTASEPTVLIAGCGGAGKAAAFASVSLGLKTVLMNRDMAKAKILAEKSPELFTARPLSDFAECFSECGIIIYAIPTSIPELEQMHRHTAGNDKTGNFETRNTNCSPKIIMEANYRNPAFGQQSMDNLKKTWPGITYATGKEWLLYQALTGYEILTGEKPDLAQMHTCL